MSSCADCCQASGPNVFAVEDAGRVAVLCQRCVSYYASPEAARLCLTRRLRRQVAGEARLKALEQQLESTGAALQELELQERALRRFAKRKAKLR